MKTFKTLPQLFAVFGLVMAFVVSPMHLKADDICYDPVKTEGFNIFGMGLFYGVTTPLRNISGESLTGVTIVKSFDGINMSMMSKIELDGTEKTIAQNDDNAEVDQALSTSFGGFNMGGMFDKGIVYYPDRDGAFSVGQTHNIYDYSMFSFSWSSVSVNAIYTKNGTQYTAKINACPTATVGEVKKNFRPFTLRNTVGTSGDNIYGDFNVTGAPIMCAKNNNNNNCNWGYSGYLFNATGKFLTDKPTAQIPLNSSSADLKIPSDATITKAYLYWSGHIYGNTATVAAYNAAIDGFNSVVLRTPDNNNHTITVNASDNSKVNYYSYIQTIGNDGFRHFYQAVEDVTDIVKNGGYNSTNAKTFTVGNLKTTAGADFGIREPELNADVKYGPMGGWSLVVQYERPTSSGQKYKNVSIFDGFDFLLPPTNQDKTIDIDISGFLTPLSVTPTGSVAFYTMGSERKLYVGEKMQITNKSGTYSNLFNSANAVGKQLNDTMTINGTQITSGRNFNPGIDLDVFKIESDCKASNGNTVACIDKNQTSTAIRLGVHNNDNTSDQSFPGMIALSVDIYQPNINAFSKDSNTSSTQKLNPGDMVEYALDFNNSGTEAAENITIYDTFSSSVGGDMLLDIIDRNATALLNSIQLKKSTDTSYKFAINSTDADVPKDANCSVEFADGNVSKATKIWCQVPYMAINDRYIMKFQVKIRDDYNQSVAEQNVTNLAYSHYYNAATHEEITVIGRSNINTAGTVGGAVPYEGKLDVVDDYDNTYSYSSPVELQTKIANKDNIQLSAVYLGTDSANYHPTIYEGDTYDMLVLFRLSDDTCTEDNPLAVSGDVSATFTKAGNQYTAVSNPFVMSSKAKKIGRIKTHFIDWNRISFSSFNGNNCINNASVDGNLKGVPQCLNGNSDKIENLFTYDVSECVTAASGKDAACDSNAYNAGGSKGNIAPEKYNNAYGCLMCLSDKVNGSANCSQDTFAIRPDRFSVALDNALQSPNMLTAGEEHNLTLRAYQFANTSNTQDYNQTSSNIEINATKRNPDGAINNALHGTASFPVAFTMTDGVSQSGAAITFDDVGKITLDINDTNWAAVDVDDTPLNDRTIHGEGNFTFIPFQFAISDVTLRGADGGTNGSFVYLSNDLNMSARIDVNITAQNKQGGTTQNFSSSLWENNISITPSAKYTSPNGTVIDGVENSFATGKFGFTGGVANVTYNDANSSKVVRFNFPRDSNVTTRNPFSFTNANGDLNITIASTYSDAGFADVVIENNDTNRDASITSLNFNYARAHTPRQRAVSATHLVNIYYESYCFGVDTTGVTCNKTLLPSGVASSRTDDVRWFVNANHSAQRDGNVTALAGSNVTATTITNGANSTSTTTLYYNGTKGYPYRATINMTPSEWLIYHPTSNTVTTNPFQIEYDKDNNVWSGAAVAGQKTKNVGGVKTNRRKMW